MVLASADPAVYLDTSVIVAWYLPEARSHDADRVFASQRLRVSADLAVVELRSAVMRLVRIGGLTSSQADDILVAFDDDCRNGALRFEPLLRDDYRSAAVLIERIGAMQGLKTADAIHLAAAYRLDLALASFDRIQCACAQLLGLALVV